MNWWPECHQLKPYIDRMKKKKTWLPLLWLVLASALGGWIYSRWNVWFGNPAEPPYVASAEPDRVLLTFGDEGELSRYVTWMCDTVVDPEAHLLLAEVHADTLSSSDTAFASCLPDTLSCPATGEVFASRSGKAAYYRVHLVGLKPNRHYAYAAVTCGHQSAWHQFRTSDPAAGKFSFLYVGDVQDTLGGIANQLLREAVSRHPEVEFVAFGGDLIERPMDCYWAETFLSIDSICTALPVVNIMGNHDYLKGLVYHAERRFSLVFPYFLKGMKERDDANHLFSFTYHNTDFFLLDSHRGLCFLYGQHKWLKEQLGQSHSTHRIALLHHPLYSVRNEHNNLGVRWMFNDLLQEAGTDLILQGHEHAYTHCTADEQPLLGHDCENPPLYVVSHCSPKNYKVKPTERFNPVLRDSRYYQIISVDETSVTLRGYDAFSHALIDSVRVGKGNE